MTPADFRDARLALGLSQGQLAHILNASRRTLQRWEAGGKDRDWSNISPQVERMMQWLADGYRPPQWPTTPR